MAVSAVKKEHSEGPAGCASDKHRQRPAKRGPGKRKPCCCTPPIALVALGGGGGAWWYLGGDAASGSTKPQPVKPPGIRAARHVHGQSSRPGGQPVPPGRLDAARGRRTRGSRAQATHARGPRPDIAAALFQEAAELLTLEGKRKLSAEIQAARERHSGAGVRPAGCRPCRVPRLPKPPQLPQQPPQLPQPPPQLPQQPPRLPPHLPRRPMLRARPQASRRHRPRRAPRQPPLRRNPPRAKPPRRKLRPRPRRRCSR
jgi:hypothetical protein